MTAQKPGYEPCSQENIFSSMSEEGSEIDIDEIETFVVGEYNFSVCPICLEHFTIHNPAIIVHCEHGFHLQCLESWRQRSAVCPVCLQPLDGDEGRLMEARDTRRRRRFRGVFSSEDTQILGAHNKVYEGVDTGDSGDHSGTCKGADDSTSFVCNSGTIEEREPLAQHVSRFRLWKWLSDWCSRV
ncbi:unnamed protein product [Phytomonas sp. EM1]|nr:unnamed protein product [Phytomonas sp. EM1]|eukprot:CCW65675.1 unnamed protein product [Phytomonas sp. isolate EM1]